MPSVIFLTGGISFFCNQQDLIFSQQHKNLLCMLNLNFIPFPILTTERLILRQLQAEDANEIFLLRSDATVNRFLDRKKADSLQDAIDFIHKITTGINNNEWIYWAIAMKDDQRLIGTISLWNIDPQSETGETGYELLPHFQGKGLMQEAISEVLHYVFGSIRLKKIEAFSHEDNQGSINLLQKNNFKRDMAAEEKMTETEGANNNIVYSLTNNDWENKAAG
jgi:ribosomal-protein-alanine N-acetyltransferase